MMNMVNTTGVGYGSGTVWLHAHWFFAAFSIVGFILFTVWALKNVQKQKLKSLSVWLLAIGIIGTLLTAPPAMRGFSGMMSIWRGKGNMHMMKANQMQQMMNMMMEHSEANNHEDHGGMMEMMQGMMGPWHDAKGNTRGMMMPQ